MTTKFSRLAALLAAASLAACGGSSDSKDAATYPTAADRYEGAATDDTAALASTTSVGEQQVRTLFPNADVDYVKVALTAGVKYEFSANRISVNSDLYLTLLDTDGVTVLGSDDDNLGMDPMFSYTPLATGTYYLRAESYLSNRNDQAIGQAAYTLSAHLFVDADGDLWSNYYDCNEADAAIHPDAGDVAGDGIDQDCDSFDALVPTVADAAEPDDTPAAARPLAVSVGYAYEVTFWGATLKANARTITEPANVDWFYVTVPAHGGAYVERYTGSVSLTVYDSDGTTELRAASTSDYTIRNTTAAEKKYFLRYSLTSGSAYYIPIMEPLGVDLDEDGAFTQDWDNSRDCNDADPAIHPGATEVAGDAVDQDCDGNLDT